MRWKGRRRSTNVEDRRGRRPGGMMIGGGLGVLGILLVTLLLGGDVGSILSQLGAGPQGPSSSEEPVQLTPEQVELGDFVRTVLAQTEDVWRELFRKAGKTYEDAGLVLFSAYVDSACGGASSAVGPFYCPGDRQVYIDLQFYEEMKRRFSIPGDFAQAYVIAHEVGHHVQNLLGVSERVHRLQQRSDRRTANQLSVRLELQADFYAGVWAHHAERMHPFLEEGDLEEALNAASRIGDDAIQKKTQGHVVRDAFTHGSSRQRVAWFRHGFETGDPDAGDTFDDEHFARIDPVGR